jgi:hypothetical protein
MRLPPFFDSLLIRKEVLELHDRIYEIRLISLGKCLDRHFNQLRCQRVIVSKGLLLFDPIFRCVATFSLTGADA